MLELEAAIRKCGWKITHVISGTAEGADTLGEEWARKNSIPVTRRPAKWRVNGVLDKGAGFKRNEEMAREGEALIALWDGQSRGTRDMIDRADTKGLRVHIEMTL
jgi:hypothetical protein